MIAIWVIAQREGSHGAQSPYALVLQDALGAVPLTPILVSFQFIATDSLGELLLDREGGLLLVNWTPF